MGAALLALAKSIYYLNLHCQLYNLLLLKKYLFGVEVNLGHAHENKILVPFRGVLRIFYRAPASLLKGSTPPPGGGSFQWFL